MYKRDDEARNSKRFDRPFDRFTVLSQVEGQNQMSNFQINKTLYNALQSKLFVNLDLSSKEEDHFGVTPTFFKQRSIVLQVLFMSWSRPTENLTSPSLIPIFF